MNAEPPLGARVDADLHAWMRELADLPPERQSAEILGKLDRAAGAAPHTMLSVMRMAVKWLPQDPSVGLAICNLADAAGDPRLALGQWRMLCQRQPTNLEAHLGYIAALLASRPVGAARTAARAASDSHPESLELWAIQARLAQRMHDWAAAHDHWNNVLRLDPGNTEAASGAALAAAQFRPAQNLGLAHQPLQPPPAEIPSNEAADPNDIKRLLLRFESLGCDCEFGLLQRRFGGEPLGLLRFSATFPRAVLSLLRSRFDGIGDADQMTTTLRGRSYGVQHARSGWRMHSNVKPAPDVTPAQVLRDQCRHAGFLRKKLVRELESASKIFVYQRHDLSDADIDAIYHAVQEYGPNLLMCVRLADPTHPAGSIEWRTERLMIGAIDRTGRRVGWDISIDYWAYFCRVALARFEALRENDPVSGRVADLALSPT